jgi:DNA-binding LacI/PurR family transcriptional regulator
MAKIFDIETDRAGTEPLHRQLYTGLKKAILSGTYSDRERLPGVSAICSQLNLSIGTVTRALNEIEREGLIKSRRGAGIFVSPQVYSIEVIVPFFPIESISPDGTLGSYQRFIVQFMRGLRDPLHNTQYRLSLTYMSGASPSASEIINICNARRALGLIEYRSSPELLEELTEVSVNIPVVSIARDVRAASLGNVYCNPEKQLQAMIESRLKQNIPRIVFACRKIDIEADNAYKSIFDSYKRICRKLSMESIVFLSEINEVKGAVEDIVKRLNLRAGDVAATTSPDIGNALYEAMPGIDIIAYTENSYSLQIYSKSISLLYLGIDRIASEAVKLLISSKTGNSNKEVIPLRKPLQPEIFERDLS